MAMKWMDMMKVMQMNHRQYLFTLMNDSHLPIGLLPFGDNYR